MTSRSERHNLRLDDSVGGEEEKYEHLDPGLRSVLTAIVCPYS